MFRIKIFQKKKNFSDFQELDLPDLLINIWSYSDVNYNSSILKEYKKYCIQIAKSKCRNERYMDFDFVIKNIEEPNTKFIDSGLISRANKAKIYRLILKDRIKHFYFFFSYYIIKYGKSFLNLLSWFCVDWYSIWMW